jgi:hypothetical protein
MSEKKAYPLRISAEILGATQRWADDELRSVNAQIEYLLREALARRGIKPELNPAKRGRPMKDPGEDEAP